MFLIYQFLIILILILSPIILTIRFIKDKEDTKRFVEKFCFISKKRISGNLIWFHAASVGELMSIIPLIKKLETENKIKTILITTSTLSSSRIIKNYKFKKTIHQFFPIDFFYFSSKFIKYWKPTLAIFIDSEIWPSMYKELEKKSIPLLLMNARITNKSFRRWKLFNQFTGNIFESIKIAFPSNSDTNKYLKKLNVKKIKNIGNLKFSEISNKKNIKLPSSFLKSIKKRLIFCASSTHPSEEKIIANIHSQLKKNINNLLTIIIPRHVQRIRKINEEIKSLGLRTIIRSTNEKIKKETDIYLVDTYGETKKFFNISKVAFIGGSIVNHGGQNPIEPARFNLNIIHGPNIDNFKDIYRLFDKKKAAFKINNINELKKISFKLLKVKRRKKINLSDMGNLILKKSEAEILKIFKDEIKKT